MRAFLLTLSFGLFATACFAQSDSSKVVKTPVERQVAIPGVDSPVSGPGLTAQEPVIMPNPVKKNGRERKTTPPSDPRGFGVSIPLEPSKKDTLRKQE